jgi:hypothetical protein
MQQMHDGSERSKHLLRSGPDRDVPIKRLAVAIHKIIKMNYLEQFRDTVTALLERRIDIA